MHTPTLFRRLAPLLLLAGLTLSACNCRKDDDPRPRCGNGAPTAGTKPSRAF